MRELVSNSTRAMLVVSTLARCVLAAGSASANPPNILMILMDDVGFADLGANGGTLIATPEMDQLAAEGMRLTNFYTNAPVCSPTRIGISTGRYPARLNVRRSISRFSTRTVPSSMTTLAEFLRGQGFVTGHFGKWHMGDVLPEAKPTAQGFDSSAWCRLGPTGPPASYWDPEFEVNDTTIETHPGRHATEVTTDYAIEFMTANQSNLFYLEVWHNAAHTPHQPPPAFASKYPNTAAGHYAALVEHMDSEIGRLLDALDGLGLSGSTLVLLLADNGGGDANPVSNLPYRGFKQDVFEGGIRAPFVARLPGSVPAGSTNASVAVGFDVFPTIADWLGVDTSALQHDGRSFKSALQTGSALPRSDPLFWAYGDSATSFVPLTPEEFDRYAVRKDNWKLVRQNNDANGDPFLFDLNSDPTEQLDVAVLHPSKVAELEADYLAWRFDATFLEHQIDATSGDVTLTGPDMLFGPSGGRVDLEADSRFDVNTGNFTFRATVTIDAYPSSSAIIASNPTSWTLSLRSDGRLELMSSGEAEDFSIQSLTLTSWNVLATGAGYDVAFTIREWDSDEDDVTIYVDGLPVADGRAFRRMIPSPDAVILGNDLVDGSPFEGRLADLVFYLAALRAKELGGDFDADGSQNSDDDCPYVYDPGQVDTDQDGMGNACDDDDDNDRLLDVDEIEIYGTNPLSADTDGDLYSDALEIQFSSDPNDPLDALVVPVVQPPALVALATSLWLTAVGLLRRRAGRGSGSGSSQDAPPRACAPSNLPGSASPTPTSHVRTHDDHHGCSEARRRLGNEVRHDVQFRRVCRVAGGQIEDGAPIDRPEVGGELSGRVTVASGRARAHAGLHPELDLKELIGRGRERPDDELGLAIEVDVLQESGIDRDEGIGRIRSLVDL